MIGLRQQTETLLCLLECVDARAWVTLPWPDLTEPLWSVGDNLMYHDDYSLLVNAVCGWSHCPNFPQSSKSASVPWESANVINQNCVGTLCVYRVTHCGAKSTMGRSVQSLGKGRLLPWLHWWFWGSGSDIGVERESWGAVFKFAARSFQECMLFWAVVWLAKWIRWIAVGHGEWVMVSGGYTDQLDPTEQPRLNLSSWFNQELSTFLVQLAMTQLPSAGHNWVGHTELMYQLSWVRLEPVRSCDI